MKTYIDISDDDLNHLIKIFDPRQDGWVNHREFVYPVYTKLNREGCSDDKDDKAEDFDQFVSSVVQWKRKAESDISKATPQTEDEVDDTEKKKSKTRKIRAVPRRFATGSPYKKSNKSNRKMNQVPSKKKKKKKQTKKTNQTKLPNIHTDANSSKLFRSANKMTRPQIPSMSPSADSRLSEMSNLVDGLAIRLEKEQKMNERLQAQLLRHQQQGELMLLRLREEQRKRKDLRTQLMARASPESRVEERRRAEEKIRKELREELNAQKRLEELKRPTNLGSFATKSRRSERLRRKKEQRKQRQQEGFARKKSRKGSRAKTPSFMKPMSKTAKRSEQFQIDETRRLIYEHIRKRKFLFQVLESNQSKTNGLISYVRLSNFSHH